MFYIEPYPKSMAKDMFDDFMVIDNQSYTKIEFNSFVGISPRRFKDVFRWGKRKNNDGSKLDWNQATSNPRFWDDHSAIVKKESNVVYWLSENMGSKGLKWNQEQL